MDSQIKVQEAAKISCTVCLLFSLFSNSVHQRPVQTVPAQSFFSKGFAHAL